MMDEEMIKTYLIGDVRIVEILADDDSLFNNLVERVRDRRQEKIEEITQWVTERPPVKKRKDILDSFKKMQKRQREDGEKFAEIADRISSNLQEVLKKAEKASDDRG